MYIGASSACFYPLETEKSLERICKAGFTDVEIFFNTPCELSGAYFDEILAVKQHYGVNVSAVHPFLSFAEGYFLFSNYERRYHDYLEQYKPLFSACERLGADIYVLHGAGEKMHFASECYAERLSGLIEVGKEFGVRVAQENIVHYLSQSPDFLVGLKKQLSDDFKMVLDVKQAYRAGYSPDEYFDKLSDSIIHLHLSDHNAEHDCLPPGKGCFDFAAFLKKASALGYDAGCMIELYRDNFTDESELVKARSFLEDIITGTAEK